MKWILLLLPFSVLANPIDDKCPQYVYEGAPISQITDGQYLCKANYAIHYRFDTRTPEYVVEHVSREAVSGTAKRKNDFRPDPEIAPEHQSTLQDYLTTKSDKYDRGHMVSAADNTQSDAMMSDTFYLSNMIPQDPSNNRGIWKQTEILVRQWALTGKDIYVISGTVYDQGYHTIGPDKVGVPDKVWKLVFDAKAREAIVFILPNKPVPTADLTKHVITVKELEKLTNINFMPLLKTDAIESTKAVLANWKLQ